MANEIAVSIYESPGAARKFAERVRDGALGRYASWVYFIGQDADGPIKIGVSEDPAKRLYELQVACAETLTLLGLVHGDETVEKTLHGAFAPDHIRGEWFRRSATLLEFIRVLGLRAARSAG